MAGYEVDVSVVIPAYREAVNLVVLLPRLAAVLNRAGLDGEIIVIDDFSDDGTGILCACLSQIFPVRLLSRFNDRGLASAVVLGLQHARGEILVVMDADLSHPPESVPRLVAACRSQNVDFVIGSRYVGGSSVDVAWSWFRRLNSRVASLLARGLTAARDPLSGFFAIKQSLLRTTAEFQPLGYKIGLEIIVRCGCRRIVEVPIAFKDRVFGRSKLTLLQQWQYVRHLARLYDAKYPGPARLVRFGLVGLSGTIVDICGFSFLLIWAPLLFSRVAAIVCATLWNFVWNRRITFRTTSNASMLRQLFAYFGATQFGAAINCSMTIWLCTTSRLFNAAPTLAAAIGAIAGATVNFILCRRWVFHENTAARVAPDQVQASHSSAARCRVA